MALNPGTRLGPYEITAAIGAGGMGEVYRARDTRLDRTVAVKVLPAHLSDNVQLRQRLEREARAVSSLNHPHICTLHDVGEQDGVHFLVMEHLDGETLDRRLERGALPHDEALRYAIQIADALDKAHRQGLIHRDLKPGNVMLSGDGAKLLDFGLAKSADPGFAGSSLTAAPTGTSPLTAEGAIVGTFQYMAPEQLDGKDADARSDIFAFGSMLYEMLTGRKAFEGKTQASLIGAIMRGEPRPPSALVGMTPPALDRLVLSCLAKDPDARRQSIRDVLLDLKWIAEGGTDAAAADVRPGRSAWPWTASTAGLAIAVVVLGWMALAPGEAPRQPMILSLPAPGSSGEVPLWNQIALSPDGRSAAYVQGDASGRDSLWIRDLGSGSVRGLPGTEGASIPFWSPDSRFLGFFSESKLKKIDTSGGPPQVLCTVTDSLGGAWNEEGVILFGGGETGGIYRVSSAGGAAEPVTTLGPKDEAHRWPAFLPDGRHFVLLVDAQRTEDHFLALGSLDSPEVTRFFNMISNVVYAQPGYLLFGRSGALMAQRFDTGLLRPVGEPVALAGNLVNTWSHRMEFSVSKTGILTYRSAERDSRLTWVDRSGKPLETVGEIGRFNSFALSPDESRVAFGKTDPDGRTGDIWLLDLARSVTTRLTFHPGAVGAARWSPDGGSIAYSSAHDGPSRIYAKRVDNPGEEVLVSGTIGECEPRDFSPDGRHLLISTWRSGISDLWVVPLDDPDGARQITSTPFSETWARFSPDGRWIGYVSDESGREEVYVVDYPAMTRRVPVSAGGGTSPKWSAEGREIYYLDMRGHLISVALTQGADGALEASPPRPLFRLPGELYFPASGGSRFLVDLPAEDPYTAPVTIVLDWTSLLPGP